MKKLCFAFVFVMCCVFCGCSKNANAISVSLVDITTQTPTFSASFEFEEDYSNLCADVFLKTNTPNTKLQITQENGKTKEVVLFEKDAYYSVCKLFGNAYEKYNDLHYLCYILKSETKAEISVCVFAGEEKTEENNNSFLSNKILISNQIVIDV